MDFNLGPYSNAFVHGDEAEKLLANPKDPRSVDMLQCTAAPHAFARQIEENGWQEPFLLLRTKETLLQYINEKPGCNNAEFDPHGDCIVKRVVASQEIFTTYGPSYSGRSW